MCGCTLHCPHPWNTQAWMYFTLSSPMEHASVDVLSFVLTHGTRKRGCTLHCPHPWNTQAWMYFTLSSPMEHAWMYFTLSSSMEHASVDVLYSVLTHGTRKRGCTLHCPHPWNTQAWMYFTLSSPMEQARHNRPLPMSCVHNFVCITIMLCCFQTFQNTHTHTHTHSMHTHTHSCMFTRTHTPSAFRYTST